MFRVIKQHVTGTYHGKQRHGMNILIAYNKSPLLIISQKGTENMANDDKFRHGRNND